jgi:hypothetical protein
MRQNGRPSAARLAIRCEPDRPQPPEEFSEAEAREWVTIVEAYPADWFLAGNLPILRQYCRHIVRAGEVGQWARAAKTDEDRDHWLGEERRQSDLIHKLARSMRLTQAGIRAKYYAAPTKLTPTARPWDLDEADSA